YGVLVLTVTSLAKDVSSSLELQCPSCEKIHCTPRRASRLRCKGGITRGICNCCPVCAKTESEDCGGDHDYLGKCDRGLYCRPNTNRVLDDYGSLPLTAVGKRRPEVSPDFIAKLQDQAMPPYCRPKCTAEHCTRNPRSICSAIDNYERKQHCQGECQHTSCRACRHVTPDDGCVKCEKDDFRCMKKYGRCQKKQYCTRQKFPCRTS
ncbi:hypothetical protein LSAT2_021867, partial [Lamellibrachia satsuma]